MIVVKTFVSELSKKVEMLKSQLTVFEEKVFQVKLIEEIIEKATLKQVNEINGEDLALISENDFKKIIDIIHFNDNDETLSKFIEHVVTDRLYAKLLLDGKVDNDLEEKTELAKTWLENYANHIKEFVTEFKLSNESYFNSLKQSDFLYKKYLSYFENDELIRSIDNIDEFNDVLKKSGLIMSEKWQLLKYIIGRNVSLNKKGIHDNVLEDIKKFLDKEKYLLDDVTSEQLDFCISLIDMEEHKLKSLNLSNEDLIKYQRIPILHNINLLYEETLVLIKENKNNKKVEQNKKDLIDFKNSYLFFDKIN